VRWLSRMYWRLRVAWEIRKIRRDERDVVVYYGFSPLESAHDAHATDKRIREIEREQMRRLNEDYRSLTGGDDAKS